LNLPRRSKNLAKKMLINSGLLTATNQFVRGSVAILKYHSIQEQPGHFDDSIGLSVIQSKSAFWEQMEILADRFNPITLDDISSILRGDEEMPKRGVAVTFDDGYADNFEIAAPILDHFGIRATFYLTVHSIATRIQPWFLRLRHAIWTTKKKKIVTPGSKHVLEIRDRDERLSFMRLLSKKCAALSREDREKTIEEVEKRLDVESFAPEHNLMMDWEQARRLQKSGHIIGSHTMNHSNIAFLKKDELNSELERSKKILEREIGIPIKHFSYPNPALTPQHTERTKAFVREIGYETAVLSSHGPVRVDDDPFLLRRTPVADHKTAFLWNLECTLLGRCV
jgi:peptidoglycan/xylan/chitin deacetylase (PgdA/CDA1 family)